MIEQSDTDVDCQRLLYALKRLAIGVNSDSQLGRQSKRIAKQTIRRIASDSTIWTDVERYILANEPVPASWIRDQFGQDGVQALSDLQTQNLVVEYDGWYYHLPADVGMDISLDWRWR